jgi:hypothetical protein
MNLQNIPFCIIKDIIFNYLDFHSQTNFRMTCKRYYRKENGVFVLNHYEIPDRYWKKLTNKILSIHNLTKFKYTGNNKITNLNHMTRLRILHAQDRYCGIGDSGIRDLNLVELNCWENPKITNVNHMTNLRVLDAGCNCGISDSGIQDLNLVELRCHDNPKITDVNHMTNLRILDASGKCCGIGDKGIRNLNLDQLYYNDNSKITNN